MHIIAMNLPRWTRMSGCFSPLKHVEFRNIRATMGISFNDGCSLRESRIGKLPSTLPLPLSLPPQSARSAPHVYSPSQ